jgi:signal transduction histidine kinase/ActR/RegA family two-component response regulator
MSIRRRLLLLVFAVWFPAAAGFALLAWYTHREEASSIRQTIGQYAQAVSVLMERELDKRVVLAHALAATKAAKLGDFAGFHEEAKSATADRDGWALLVTADWQILNTKGPYPAAAVRRAKSWPLTEDVPQIVFVPHAPVSRTAAITVFVPIAGHEPQRFNVGVSFEPAMLQKSLNANPGPFKALTTVINAEHVIMARSRDPAKWFGTAASAAFKQRIGQGGVGFAESVTLDGVPSLTFLSPPNAYGWSVVVAVPAAELTKAADRASAKAWGASALLLIIGLAFALVGTRRISRTVRALEGAAALLGDNKVPPLLSSGVSEVDAVAHAMRSAGVKAQDVNASLERRVNAAVQAAEEAQAKLLQSQKLEVIGRLTAGVAHDFNNLLQTIRTAHHLLGRWVEDGNHRRHLESAARAVSKAGDLVKQLMTFGRMQALEPTNVSIADVVLNGQELTSKAVGERVTLTASIEPGLPHVHVDPVQLEMALLNLVFNARDAMPGGGHITINARVALPEETLQLGSGKFVRLEVADDGAGMTQEVQARAFEPYFTTKPVGSGSGIGLAQVDSFARQSGGEITLTSEVGKGTSVCLYLPVAKQPMRAPMPFAAQSRATKTPLAVLMVEDDVLVSSVVHAALEEDGHSVTLCHTADDAVEVLKAGAEFDLLFTDVVMPGRMNGIDLVQWCALNRPELRVLITTGYAENLSNVSVSVLRKPYDIDTLIAALNDAAIPAVAGQAS